jgi:hypothetical protein
LARGWGIEYQFPSETANITLRMLISLEPQSFMESEVEPMRTTGNAGNRIQK